MCVRCEHKIIEIEIVIFIDYFIHFPEWLMLVSVNLDEIFFSPLDISWKCKVFTVRLTHIQDNIFLNTHTEPNKQSIIMVTSMVLVKNLNKDHTNQNILTLIFLTCILQLHFKHTIINTMCKSLHYANAVLTILIRILANDAGDCWFTWQQRFKR